MSSIDTEEIAALIRPGRVHRRVYTDPAIFNLELENIFGSAWIYVGHESQVKNPGDFLATSIGRKPRLTAACAHRARASTASPVPSRGSRRS